MIPILFEKTETEFDNNGLGRLRDCTECIVSEERNGIYECDFSYPVTGAHYDDIKLGRIIGVTHDDTGDLEPFDIVSFSKPISGVVSFHAVHISYRQSYMTVTGSNINSLADAFALLGTAEPDNPFVYQTDKTSLGYMAAADGTPRTVRQMLGGVEGSILDAYGGEYEWSNFAVYLHSARGVERDFSIRYGVNMLEYNDEADSSGTYSSCIPYWTNGGVTVVGSRVDGTTQTATGRGECVPLDLSDKFEEEPTVADLKSMAVSIMNSRNTALPSQTISISFVRLQDMSEYSGFENLYKCRLCDTINVIFPDYGTSGQFKIVKTVWNVLMDRYDSMELGTLSTTLSEALGISNGLDGASSGGGTAVDLVIEQGTSDGWTYRKWDSGIAECWERRQIGTTTFSSQEGYGYYAGIANRSFPTGLFNANPTITFGVLGGGGLVSVCPSTISNTYYAGYLWCSANGTRNVAILSHAIGTWK